MAHYAVKMNMQPSALCRLVKKESGHTAMEIINQTLIMDAKTQLRTENTPVKDIALGLGFNNAAFFNKFLRNIRGDAADVSEFDEIAGIQKKNVYLHIPSKRRYLFHLSLLCLTKQTSGRNGFYFTIRCTHYHSFVPLCFFSSMRCSASANP